MTRNQYIRDNGYMAWLGKKSLKNEIECLLVGFGISLTAKQINAISEIAEHHIKEAK
tara:strand:- start:17795 stop:17965 length:171 start_codon:yes stop_codon:yes gene_type:complete